MIDNPSGYQRLFADLKRRAVFKVAAVYVMILSPYYPVGR